jgi:hypothetical protein
MMSESLEFRLSCGHLLNRDAAGKLPVPDEFLNGLLIVHAEPIH